MLQKFLQGELLESMVGNAEYESKLKRLGDEILRTMRKIRVLEEIIFPDLRREIRTITQFIGEREREAHFRLKRFKTIHRRYG